jgi:hypothetical protein
MGRTGKDMTDEDRTVEVLAIIFGIAVIIFTLVKIFMGV